jgi:thioredoxin-related protein
MKSLLLEPTLLFLDKTGTEIPGTRVNGFMSPSAFLSHLSLIATQANLSQPQTALRPK